MSTRPYQVVYEPNGDAVVELLNETPEPDPEETP